MARNGKIARLPKFIRAELNQRLREGKPGKHLVKWLNGLPKVQAFLKAKFEGQPIAENNLLAWKTGGYQAWEQEQATQEGLDSFMEKARALQTPAEKDLIYRMVDFVSVKMAVELN